MKTDIRETIMELKIRKALVEHWNPEKAEMYEEQINQLTNYENKTQTQRGTGERHSRNYIRQVESGCKEKCQESNETNNLHS